MALIEKVWTHLAEMRSLGLMQGVQHELVHIDLSAKPAWYSSVNSRGLVPALYHKGEYVTESVDVCKSGLLCSILRQNSDPDTWTRSLRGSL